VFVEAAIEAGVLGSGNTIPSLAVAFGGLTAEKSLISDLQRPIALQIAQQESESVLSEKTATQFCYRVQIRTPEA
jgi:hypothetical protein